MDMAMAISGYGYGYGYFYPSRCYAWTRQGGPVVWTVNFGE